MLIIFRCAVSEASIVKFVQNRFSRLLTLGKPSFVGMLARSEH